MDNNYNDTRYLDLTNKEQGASILQQYQNLVLEKKEANICSLVGCISFSPFLSLFFIGSLKWVIAIESYFVFLSCILVHFYILKMNKIVLNI